MSEDLAIGHDARHAIALLINHDRRYAHHETSVSQLCLHALDGVARTAGQAIAVERTVKCGTWVKGARQNANWIVAAVTMACVFNPLCPDQDIDTGAVKRCPESIGMQRLTPLMVCLLVAMAAVVSICLAYARFGRTLVLGATNCFRAQDESSRQDQDKNDHAPAKSTHILYGWSSAADYSEKRQSKAAKSQHLHYSECNKRLYMPAGYAAINSIVSVLPALVLFLRTFLQRFRLLSLCCRLYHLSLLLQRLRQPHMRLCIIRVISHCVAKFHNRLIHLAAFQ